MRVLITGITSFLGLYTAQQLLQAGHQLFGAVRPGSRRADMPDRYGLAQYGTYHAVSLDLDALPAAGDAEGYEALRPQTEEPLLDAWIHFAWDGVGSAGRSDTRIQQRNIENAKKAYVYARALGARKFLFAGSQAEYGRGSHLHPQPVSAYGQAKLRFGRWAAEQSLRSELCDEAPTQFLHMRIYSVYGDGDHETSLVHTVLQAALRQEEMILGPCTQRWNYLEVHDLARAVRILLESEDTRTAVYDIAGSDSRPLREYVLAMNEIVKRAVPEAGAVLRFGARGDNAEGAADMCPDTRPLMGLGFQQEISFAAGIDMLLHTLQQDGGCGQADKENAVTV